MYLMKSTALQILCRHNLEAVKLKNYVETSLYFDDSEKAVNELKQADAVITEQEKLNYMLKLLPKNYSYIGDLIDVLPEKDRTVEYLKSKIKLKNAEEKSNEEPTDSSNVFRAEAENSRRNYICYNCGKQGHFKKDCRNNFIHKGQKFIIHNIIIVAHEDEKLHQMKSYINVRTPKVFVSKKNSTKER